MAKPRVRLTPEKSIVREYIIVDTHDQPDNDTGVNITVCKYVKPKKVGDNWEEVVMKEWVENPKKFELKGAKIRVETSIVE